MVQRSFVADIDLHEHLDFAGNYDVQDLGGLIGVQLYDQIIQ